MKGSILSSCLRLSAWWMTRGWAESCHCLVFNYLNSLCVFYSCSHYSGLILQIRAREQNQTQHLFIEILYSIRLTIAIRPAEMTRQCLFRTCLSASSIIRFLRFALSDIFRHHLAFVQHFSCCPISIPIISESVDFQSRHPEAKIGLHIRKILSSLE